MAKSKTTQDYIEELKSSIEKKTDTAFDPWLMPMLRATAMNMVILDKMQDKLEKENITNSMTGSMGQQKIEVNPLLEKYYKAQSVLIDQFDALGLNQKSKKNGPSTKSDDPIGDYLESIKG